MPKKQLVPLDLTPVPNGTAPLSVTSTTAVTNLNADLLDGQHGSFYQNASNLNAGTVPVARTAGISTVDTRAVDHASNAYPSQARFDFKQRATLGWPGTGTYGGVLTVTPWNDSSGGSAWQMAFGTDGVYIRTAAIGSAWGSWNTVWHSGNGGAASGLDADLLDGQHGSYYLNASNLNAGTVADARLSSNVPLKNAANTFTANQTVSNATEAQLNLECTGGRSVRFLSNSTPNVGIYDFGATKWLLRIGSDDSVNVSSINDTAGNLRDIQQNTQNATYTFVLADRGKHVIKTNTTAYTWTIPLNSTTAFPVGTAILVINDGTAGNVTIARTSGVALLSGSTDANFTLLPGESRTLLKIGTDRWRVL